MNKSVAFFIGFIFVMLPVASAGIIYDEETREVSEIAGKWLNTWGAQPDTNWTADAVQLDDQNLYFGDSEVGIDYSKHMTISDDGAYGAINYAQSGPGSELNTYFVNTDDGAGQYYGKSALAMSDDGNYIIYGDEENAGSQGSIFFFGLEEGPIWSFKLPYADNEVDDIAISDDGEYAAVATAGTGANRLIFQRENNTLIHNSSMDEAWLTAISGNGKYAAFTGENIDGDDAIYVHDIENNVMAWGAALDDRPYEVKISGDGEIVIVGLDSGSHDELQVFDSEDGTLLWSANAADDVRGIDVTYDHSKIVFGDWDGYTYLYNGITGTEIWSHIGDGQRIRCEPQISNDGEWLANLRSEPDSLMVWNSASSTPVLYNNLDELPSGSGLELDMSDDGHYIALFDSEEHFHIFYDGNDGWQQSDSIPIWSKHSSGSDAEIVISSGGTFAFTEEDEQTLSYGKIPIFTNSYNHDEPIYDEMWADDDHATDLADYEAIGDLEGLYLFEEGAGTSTKDYSGNGNDGVLNPTGEPVWKSGKMGGGIGFDGVDDYVQIGDEFDDLTEISFGGWAKVDATTGVTQTMFSKYYSKFRIGMTGSNYYFCELNGGAATWRYGPNAVGTEGEWHHHVCVYNKIDGSLKYYYDGIDASGSYSGDNIGWDPSGGAQVNIGAHAGSSWHWNGDLDEIFLYSNDLSASDVAALYAISHDRMESGLVGHWRMEEGTGSTVEDLSGNGNEGTITGATWDTGYFGNGLDFDGSTNKVEVSSFTNAPNTAVTVSYWINLESHTGTFGAINMGGAGDHRLYTDGRINSRIWTDAGVDEAEPNPGEWLTKNQWHHIAFTWAAGGNHNTYLNGVQVGSDASIGTVIDPAFDSFEIFPEAGGDGNGKIDEVQVWLRDLTAAEITDLYNLHYHGSPSGIDSAQLGRYVVSRTNSGEGGGGLTLFDTHSGTLATPKWTADVGPGDLVGISDNAAPIIISGSTNGEVKLHDLAGTERMSFTSELAITGIAIMDDNSYAFASSADHYLYGFDLHPVIDSEPDWSVFLDSAATALAFDGTTLSVGTEKGDVIAFNTAGVEQWRENIGGPIDFIESSNGRILADSVEVYDDEDIGLQLWSEDDLGIQDDSDTSMYYKLGVPDLLYQFDSASTFNVNDPITDSSVNGFDGTVKDWFTSGHSHKSDGVLGSGFYSESRQVEILESPTFADDYTLSLWIKPEIDDGTQRGMIQKVNFWSLGWTLILQDCKVKAGFGSSTGSDYWSLQSEELCNAWHHVVMTLDKSETEVKLYVDGELVDTFNSALFAGDIEPTNDMSLGYYSGGTNYIGYYDEVAVWDGKHSSETEIRQLFEDTKGRVYDVEDDLIGYWPLDNDADDYSGNGYDGVITTATPSEGHVGGAYYFSGSDEITISDNLDEITTSDEFTVAAWFNADSSGSGYRWIVARGTAWGAGNLGIYLHTDGTIQASAYDVSGAQTISSSTNGWDDDNWHHVVYSYDGERAKLHVDGKLNAWGDSSGDDLLSHSTAEIKIGDRSGANFEGTIDEVAIWDRAIGNDEAKQLFYNSQGQFQSSLLAFYPFVDLDDYSGNGHDLEPLAGGATIDLGLIFEGVVFDGVNDYAEITDTSEDFGGHGGMTWNFWVQPTGSGTSGKVIIDKLGVFRFYINPTGTFYGYIYLETAGENAGYGNCAPSSPFQFDSWQMLTVTYDSSDTSLRYYYDGVEFHTCDLSTGTGTAAQGELIMNNNNPVCIASQECGGSAANFYEGKADEIGVWSRALSVEEIGELYNVRSYDKDKANTFIFTTDGEVIGEPGGIYTYSDADIAEDGTIAFVDDTPGYCSNSPSVYTTKATCKAVGYFWYDGPEMQVWANTLNSAASFSWPHDSTNENKNIQVSDGGGNGPVAISTGDFTVCGWVKADDADERNGIISDGYYVYGSNDGWGLGMKGGAWRWNVNNAATGLSALGSSTSTTTDWTHLCGIRDDEGRKLFVNGVLDASDANAIGLDASNTNDLNFGVRSSVPSQSPRGPFNGAISDVRIYTSALSSEEILTLSETNPVITGMYASIPSTEAGWWKLDEDFSSGVTAADSSGNGNTGTNNGAETYYENMPARYGVFDGVEGTQVLTEERQIYGNDDLQTATASLWMYVANEAPSLETAIAYGRAWGTSESLTGGFMMGAHSSSYIYNLHSTDGSGSFNRDSCNHAPSGSYSSSDNYGEWVHLTMKFDSTMGVTDSLESYLNGHKVYTCSSTYSYVNTPSNSYYEKLSIGAVEWGGQAFEGFIADVRIFNTALSQEDITSLASINPATTGKYADTFATPVSWYKLNGNAEDSTDNELTANENGGLLYNSPDSDYIFTDKGSYYTGGVQDVAFGNSGSTLVAVDDRYGWPMESGRVTYWDSLGNGWQTTDSDESFHIYESGLVTTVMEDNRNLVWGTSNSNTHFKTPGLHPTSANVIAFWQLQAGTGRPVYTKVVPQIVNNGTWWAGAMAVSVEGDLWVESKYDGDGGQQYFALYKYDKLGNLETTLTQETYHFMKKQIFNPDSRSSIDIATNGSVLLSIDNNFIFISEDTPNLLTIEGNDFSGPGQVKFLGDTGLVALSGAKGSANEYAVYNLHTNSVVWQFNSDVTAFQIDASDNGDYIIFTNGTQMLFKAPTNNTLFTKAIAGVKAASVANNGVVAVASSTEGWFIYDKTGDLLLSGGSGQRVYDIDLDHAGNWFAVSGYDIDKGSAWMEVWALEEDRPFYEKYDRAFRTEKSSDTGDIRSYRVMMGEGSIQVLWGWAGPGGSGAELYTFEYGITLMEILEANINLAFSTIILIAIIIAMIGFLRKMIKGSGIVG